MLKKTSAYTGLVIVTAAGALLASSPAYALDGLVRGSSVHNHHRSHHRNRNWNGNAHHGRIFIRIYIYNKNNNHAVAIARPERRREHRPTSFLGDDTPFFGGAGDRQGVARTNREVPATGTAGSGSTGTVPVA